MRDDYFNRTLQRYLYQDEKTIEDVYKRSAKSFLPYDSTTLYNYLCDGVFLLNSPALANAGTTRGGRAACYVLPVQDSLEGIYKTLHDQGMIHKAFGGTGFNLSAIRPAGEPISSTGGTSCGPLGVLELLNTNAHVIRQGGKREGANMGILHCDHPDIDKFIAAKDIDGSLTHFNLSVNITDEKMRDDDFVYSIAEHSYQYGDPGVIFIDRMNEGPNSMCPNLPLMNATNPCGEQSLRPYESCNLGSINLSKFVDEGEFDYDTFGCVVQDAIVILDNVISEAQALHAFPLPEVQEATLLTRKIGLGVMGWADTLILMGIPWKSQAALDIIDKIGRKLQENAYESSSRYGEEHGCFPAWEESKYAEMGSRRRNETLTTIAPTGTLSYLANCSSGIEPNFAWETTRTSELGTTKITHPLYESHVKGHLDKDLANLISFEWHINHQARWQKYIDNAVSKTINLPKSSSIDDIDTAIKIAHKMKCKGITIYRDGSKSVQVLSTTKSSTLNSRERHGTSYWSKTGCGKIDVKCNNLGDTPYEVWIDSDGGCPANNKALGVVISKYIHDPRLSGQERDTIERISRALRKVKCVTAAGNSNAEGISCAAIVAKRIHQVWLVSQGDIKPKCPQCGVEVNFASGCSKGECPSCGWSGCS